MTPLKIGMTNNNNFQSNREHMLVKIGHGASVNPDNLKHITVEQKADRHKNVFVVEIKMDDNTKHPIAFLMTETKPLRWLNPVQKTLMMLSKASMA